MKIDHFFYQHSVMHRANPVVKFVSFLTIIFLLFSHTSLFIQLILIVITLLIIHFSYSWSLLNKKMLYTFIFLFFFLFCINWIFKKNPGFWNLNLLDGYQTAFGHKSSINANDGEHGWYYGGEVMKEGGKMKLFENPPEKHLVTEFANGKYVAFKPKWYTITGLQIYTSLYISIKLIVVILLSSILTTTTSLFALSYALEDLFRPLKIFRIPAKELSLIVALSLRFTPSLIQEAFRIIKAQSSRGIDFKSGKITDKINALISLFIPLFVVAFYKSDELSSAMISRGYRPKEIRTSYRTYPIYELELCVFFLFMSLMSFLYYFHICGYYFAPFGITERIIKFS